MNSRRFFLAFLFIVILFNNFIVFVQANDYSLGIKEGDTFVWEVTVVDENGLEAMLGSNWVSILGELSIQGVSDKIEIIEISESLFKDNWVVKFKKWKPTASNFNEIPDIANEIELVKQNPTIFDTVKIFCPLPVENYLRSVYGSNSFYKVESSTIKYPYKNGDKEITYDLSTGVTISQKFLYVGKVVWEYSRVGIIYAYMLPILLLITVACIIGLIVTFIRTKRHIPKKQRQKTF